MDTMLHPFEKAGLGKAPFHCTHVEDAPSGCQFCGTAIRYRYYINGADGSSFYVGSDCVAKTGGHQHISNFRAVRTELVRKQRAKKAAERAAERKAKWAAEALAKRAQFDAENPGLYDTLKALGAKSLFCADMVRAIDRYGDLTPRQLEVSKRIVADELEKARLAAQGGLKLAGSMDPLVQMFRKAKEHLKYPKLTVQVDGKPYTFSLAGDTSKNPGCVYVKSNGQYLGKVTPAAEFHAVREATQADRDAISKFSTNPAQVAGLHGHVTGNCCFCSKQLTDERSTQVGYGPVCANHYGLPWG